MKQKETGSRFILKLELGNKFMESMLKFLKQKGIRCSSFQAIGAVSEADIAFYDLQKKEYKTKKFKGLFEVTGLTGNSAMHKGVPIIHAHATLADEEYKAFGGHVMELVTAGALEVIITPLRANIQRKHDEKTGLKLLDI